MKTQDFFKKANIVSCDECGCLVKKEDASSVVARTIFSEPENKY